MFFLDFNQLQDAGLKIKVTSDGIRIEHDFENNQEAADALHQACAMCYLGDYETEIVFKGFEQAIIYKCLRKGLERID